MPIRRTALAARREALGFTQETLAMAMDVEFSTVGRWERGALTPQPWRRQRLANVLQVSLTDLDALLNPCTTGSDEPHLQRRLAPSIPDSAVYLDELVIHLQEQWHALVRTDNLLGPRFALTAVLDHLAIIEDLLPATSGARRAELVRLAATYAESASWLYEDTGQQPASAHWVSRAMEWAHEAGDDLLLARTLFRRSQHAAAEHDAQRTISLTQAAWRHHEQLPNPTRAAIAQQHAYGHALAGEEKTCHQALDKASGWAALDKAGEARSGPGSFCSEIYLELQRAHCWAVLGKHKRAVQLYEASLPTLPPVYRRDCGVACSRLARAYVHIGEPEPAAQAAQEALVIARSSGSVRTEQDVASIGRSLTEHRHLQPVEHLLAELATDPTA